MGDNALIRVGILGASRIAPRAVIVPSCNLDGVVVHGIAARDRARADEFARCHAISQVFDSYSALIESDEIDMVYTPLPNDLHAPWTLMAVQAGKHVLVEKPACLNAKQADDIERAATQTGVHVLEAVMTQHHGSQAWLRELIASGRYGPLLKLETHLSFNLPNSPEDYRFKPSHGGGVFHDISAYWLQFSQLCFDQPPAAMGGRSDFAGPRGIDRSFSAWLDYPGGGCSQLLCSWERSFIARHRLLFDGAVVEISNFLRPCFGNFAMTIHIDEFNVGRHAVRFRPSCYYTQQLTFMASVLRGEVDNLPWVHSRERADQLNRIYTAAWVDST
jgi:predicted dehydrogenase